MADNADPAHDRAGTGPGSRYVIPFEHAADEPIRRIGGKCAGLAALARANAPVSPGFAVTTDAFDEMMAVDGLGREIGDILARLEINDVRSEARVSRAIADAVMRRAMPPHIAAVIRQAYRQLGSGAETEAAVAVRSSGTGEDLPDASFAGQGDTYLSIVGADAVLDRVRRCWASLYTARAISYRAQCGMGQTDVQMAVAIQVMVEARSAGVAMTLDPSNGDRSKIVIESTWGFGETLVSGEVTPNHFLVDKVLLMPISRRIAIKDHELVSDPASRAAVRREVDEERRGHPSVSEEELHAIALTAKTIERHFGCPQDIEWAIDEKRTESGGVVILQSRPETVWSKKRAHPSLQAGSAPGAQGILDTLIAPLLARTGKTASADQRNTNTH